MRRLLVIASAAALFVAMMAGPAAAQGVSPEKLEKAGWTCMSEGAGAPTHCLPRGEAVFTGEVAASIIMSVGPDGEFWGTELLIHHDLYNGQPCPQDDVDGGDGTYLDVEPLVGVPYFVCHHFDSPIT